MKVRTHLLEPDADRALTARFFLKGLALVYAVAFASLAVQIDGLAGPEGILPLQRLLDRAFEAYGFAALWRLPTLFWLGSGSAALRGAAIAGVALAGLLFFGFARPRPLLVALFALYLSLYQAGQIFTSFQWDYLLLECGFLAIVLAGTPTRLAVLLYHWLLFRLRFLSGYFKLASGDPSWRDFSALDHYFETQPLPHAGSWYAHQLPHWMHEAGVGFTLFAELIVPFFIFLPRPWRLFAAAVTILAQLAILATSNHNFINFLTILLCLFLLDDRLLRRALPAGLADRLTRDGAAQPGTTLKALTAASAILILAVGAAALVVHQARRPLAAGLVELAGIGASFGIGNLFHLFPTMQTERQELRIFGSADGAEWRAYEFRYKPGAPDQAPKLVAPHQPRLDWMMWFLPPQSPVTGYWFAPFLEALRENRPVVADLLATNPFAGAPPPRYLRVLAYRYRFTTPGERAATGNWWHAELLGEFPDVPPRQP